MLELYHHGSSVCAAKARFAINEKGVPWTGHYIDILKGEQFDPAYLKLNPKGVVPALDHDGRIVIESSLICEYLDDCFPAPSLVPADPWARARMRLWSKNVDEVIFEATRELSFSAMFRERMKNMSDEQREGRYRNVGDPIKRARLISTYEEGVESVYVFQGIAAYEKMFKAMESDLADGQIGRAHV